jgi:hypothetical protein
MLEVLFFDGCPSATEAETLVRRVLVEEGRVAPLLKIAVETPEQAVAIHFLGSPTVRVNGRDIEPVRAHEPGRAMSLSDGDRQAERLDRRHDPLGRDHPANPEQPPAPGMLWWLIEGREQRPVHARRRHHRPAEAPAAHLLGAAAPHELLDD